MKVSLMKVRISIAGIVLLAISVTPGGAQEEVILDKVEETQQMRYDYSFSEGLKYKMLNNVGEAAKLFQLCSELNPELAAPYYELARIALMSGDVAGAHQLIERALQIDGNNEWYNLVAIQVAIQLKQHEKAAFLYRKLYDLDNEKAGYLLAEIDQFLLIQEYGKALKSLDLIEKEMGFHPDITIRRKNIYLAQGKNKKAIKEMERLANIMNDNVEYRGMLAELLVELGEETRALEEYERIKSANSGNPIVYFSLGQFYLEKGEREKAIKEFSIGFASKQVNPDIKANVFIELLKGENGANQLSEELEGLLFVLYENEEGHPQIDRIYADYAYNQEKFELAEGVYKRVVESDRSSFQSWQNLLFIQNNQQDFVEMFELADRAIKAFPNQSIFYLFKGIGGTAINKMTAAIEALKRGSRLNPNNGELTKQYYISLGDAYYKNKNYTEAFKNFDLLLVLEPENVVVLNNYSYYLSLLGQDLDKAMNMISRCVAIEENNPTYLDTQAWVLFKTGRYAEALEIIEKVIELDNESSGEVWEHYGDILYKNKNVDEAVKAWEMAKSKGDCSENIDIKILNKKLYE